MSANKYRVNITCPRCRFVGDIEESFPCDCSGVLGVLEQKLIKVTKRLLAGARGPVALRSTKEDRDVLREDRKDILRQMRAAIAKAGK